MRAKYPFLARTVMLLCAILMTVTAWGDDVTYLDSDGTTKTATGAIKITSSNSNVTFYSGGWYYVSGEVTIEGPLEFTTTDDVNIILCDDANLTIDNNWSDYDIYCGGNLTIVAQSTGNHMGKMRSYHNSENHDVVKCEKDVTIKGGNIGLFGLNNDNCKGVSAQNISISDGHVEVSSSPISLNATGNITISGGEVNAQGKIVAGQNITLGWTKNNDYIKEKNGYEVGANGSVSASKPFITKRLDSEDGTLDGGTIDATTLAAIKGMWLRPLVIPLLKNNLANADVTFYDAGTTAPTASTFDADNPGTALTADGLGSICITPGHYVVMYVQPEDGYWTDAQLLSCRETNGGTKNSDSRAVTLLARTTGTYWNGDTYTYYNGAGWYYYQVPAANTVDAGYTQSELNGDVLARFDLAEKNNITQNGKVVTVTDGTVGGWSAVLTVDEVSYQFDGNEHQPKYTSIVIKKGNVTKITLTDATLIGGLLEDLDEETYIGRHYLDIDYKTYYGWFYGNCWDRTVAGFDITMPLSTAKSYDANDPTTILGCETNPWLITSAAELNMLAKCVNIGRYTFEGEYLQVTENIDMSEIDDFMPIGTNASFCGTFDGNSKTISNISLVVAPDDDEEEDDMDPIPVGLFGEVGYVKYEWDDETPAETPVPAVVKNFTLQDCTFNDGGYSLWTGGVAGQVKKGSTISGVTLTGCTIQSSAFPRIMPIDDVLGYVVPRVGGVAGESVGLIENCTMEDCAISSQVTKLEPVPSDEGLHMDAPTQWNVVGGIVGTTIQSAEEMPELELRAKRRAPAQQPVSVQRRRLRDNSIELTGNRVKGATTITSDIAGDVVSPVGTIFGELENGTVLSDNKYGLNVTVTRKMGSQETTTTTAKGYTPRGLTGLKDNDVVFKDITENEGAMMEVYPVTISPVATMTGYTMPNPLAEVTATEALEAGKNCYQIVEGTPYFAPTDNINLAVAATQITKKEDGRNLHADLALKMNSDDLTVTNGVATFTMPAAAATVTGTFTEASWFTVDTNNKKWMSFYHEWMTATDDKTGAGGQTPVAANYTVTDASENVNTPKTIVVKTVSNVNTKNGDVTMSDLAGVSFNGVPTLFSCQDGTALPAQLRFTPNTTATKPATWAPEFKGVKEDTEMTGKTGVYIMNGSGDFIYAVITPADNTLAAHRCYIDMDNVTGGAPLRIVEDEEPTGIETTDNGQQTTDSWYTLSGVKLDEKPVVKGVYIHNGKKVVIK